MNLYYKPHPTSPQTLSGRPHPQTKKPTSRKTPKNVHPPPPKMYIMGYVHVYYTYRSTCIHFLVVRSSLLRSWSSPGFFTNVKVTLILPLKRQRCCGSECCCLATVVATLVLYPRALPRVLRAAARCSIECTGVLMEFKGSSNSAPGGCAMPRALWCTLST